MTEPNELLGLTAEIVVAHVANNPVSVADLPALISKVHGTLAGLGTRETVAVPAEAKPPPVPVKKSLMPDYIVCLEDGKKLKMLKRHLHSAYGMTPDQYRAKWGLPSDYPMVAPNYAAKRSALVKEIRLGHVRKDAG